MSEIDIPDAGLPTSKTLRAYVGLLIHRGTINRVAVQQLRREQLASKNSFALNERVCSVFTHFFLRTQVCNFSPVHCPQQVFDFSWLRISLDFKHDALLRMLLTSSFRKK